MPLEVRLAKPIEDLLPKSIDWNGAELLAVVKELLVKYDGKTYDENSIAEAKADKAALNNTIKMLDNMRLDLKRTWDAPYLAFKAEVDAITKAIGDVNNGIDAQVKNFEERRKADKDSELRAYFTEKIVLAGLDEFVKYDLIFNSKWLNASEAIKKCYAEIDAKVEQIQNELATIEALKSEDESTLKAYYYRNLNLSAALMENSRLQDDRKRVAAAKAAREAAEAARAAALAEQQAKLAQTSIAQEPIDAVRAQPTEQPKPPLEVPKRMYAVSFKVSGTESQITALRDFLNGNHINFEIINKEKP